MSVPQEAQYIPVPKNGGFIHLQVIDVNLAGTRPYSKLKIELKGEQEFWYQSDVVESSLLLHWDCDIYVKSQSKAVLSIRYIGLLPHRTVDKVDIVFSSKDFEPGKVVLQKGQKSVATIKLYIGPLKLGLDVARLLAPRTISALGMKVAMLDKLNRVFKICDLVLKLGLGVSEVNPYAKAATSIVSTLIEKFRDIPSFHNELVLIMYDVMELLPIMELALKRITDEEVQGIVQTFFEFVVALSNNLKDYASKPPLKFILRNWYEPRKDEIRKIKDRLACTIRNLNIGLQANALSITTTIHEHQLSEAEEKTLERLLPPEDSAYDPSRGCLRGTRRRVLQNIEEWVYSRNHSQQIYWIHGVAGCGKSSVATSVADALERQKILSGSFFCKRDIPERRSTGRLVRSLAYFLAQRVTAFRQAILHLLKADPAVLDKPLSYQFNILFLKSLAAVPREMESELTAIIVIDALDECEDGESAASQLASMVQAAPWIRLIVTSRPDLRIKKNMLRTENLVQQCDLFRVTTIEDILYFIQEQFNLNDELPRIGPSDEHALARRASGHFLWIATVLKHVSVEAFGKKRLLQQIIDSGPHASSSEEHLDSIYLRVLEDACRGSAGRECAVRSVIGLVFVISKNRPLPSRALHAFIPSSLGASQDELDVLLGHLESVLYQDAQTGAIRACHPSFLDFVGSMERSGRFWTDTAELEASMAGRCLQIMLSELKFNICRLETSYYANSDVLDLSYRIHRNIPHHLQYSSLYWFNHLCRSQSSTTSEDQVQQMLHDFLRGTSSLYWLEVLSVMTEIRAAIIALQELPSVLKRFKVTDQLVYTASDLYRFVMAFREPMATSAPHIYLSALLWAPVNSMVVRHYCNHFNSRQCILKGVNDYWPMNLHTMSAHSGVLAVAFSPDGRHIISGSLDNTVYIWDAETGAPVGTLLEGHHGWVRSVAYSPDGRRIVSGSEDKTVRIWDVETGTQVGAPLEGHQDCVHSVACSPDGRQIVSGSKDRTVRIWDVETGVQVGNTLKGHQDYVNSVAYSPDGRHIASGSSDMTVCIWDAETGAQVGTPLKGHQHWVHSVAYSPDGRHIVSGSEDKTVCIWNVETSAQAGTPLKGHQESVYFVAYSPDGRHIVSGSFNGTVCIQDAETGVQVGSLLEGHQHSVHSVVYSPDGRHIVSGSSDKTVRIWDARTGVQVDTPRKDRQGWFYSVDYSPDGRHIVSGSDDGLVCIWDTETGARVGSPLEGHQGWVHSVAYSLDGRRIVSGSKDNTVIIWNAETGAQVGTPLRGHQHWVHSVAYSPDGRNIVSGSLDKTLCVWDAETGKQIGTPLRGHRHWVLTVSYSPDGRHIASGSSDKTVHIWDAETGARVGTPLEGHEGWIHSIAYSPDGRYIVSGSSDKTVRIWNAETGAQVGTPLEGHQDCVHSVVYSPDGRYIASGSYDKTVRVWNAETGVQVGTPLERHQHWVYAVAYSPDGQHIVSGSRDKTMRIWYALDATQSDSSSGVKKVCETEARSPANNQGLPFFNSELGAGSMDDYNTQGVYSTDVNGFVRPSSGTAGETLTTPVSYTVYPSSVPVDGWIRTATGDLILWIPYEYRDGLRNRRVDCFPRNVPGHPVRLDWSKLCHGDTWTKVKISDED